MFNVDIKQPIFPKDMASSKWLKNFNLEGFKHLSTLSFPKKKEEDWKYTDPSILTADKYVLSNSPGPLSNRQLTMLNEYKQPEFINLVFIDGYFSKEFSDPLESKRPSRGNIHFIPFQEIHSGTSLKAYGIDGDILALFKLFNRQDALDVIDALNQTYLQDGGLFVLEKNTTLNPAIHCLHIVSKPKLLANSKLFFYCHSNSSVTIINTILSDAYLDGQGYSLHNLNCEIYLKEASKAKLLLNTRQGPKARQLTTIRLKQLKDSSLQAWHSSQGASLERINWTVDLNQPGAECHLNGAYYLNHSNHLDHTLKINHHSPYTRSCQLFKGIVDDKAHSVFNGLVRVSEAAKECNSSQLNQNILLNSEARVDTRPQLVIHNNDVKCTHGATIGQLEPEELFYLMSRGFSREESVKLLSQGFLLNALEELPHQCLPLALKALGHVFKIKKV